jgi:hypothetical protein
MSFAELGEVAVPAYAGIVNLRAARPVPTASPGAPAAGTGAAP